MLNWCECKNHVTSWLGVWGTLQQENVFRFLIMIPFFCQKLIFLSAKLFQSVFCRQMPINNNHVFFTFNKIKYKGGDGYEILLNSGKEVISF